MLDFDVFDCISVSLTMDCQHVIIICSKQDFTSRRGSRTNQIQSLILIRRSSRAYWCYRSGAGNNTIIIKHWLILQSHPAVSASPSLFSSSPLSWLSSSPSSGLSELSWSWWPMHCTPAEETRVQALCHLCPAPPSNFYLIGNSNFLFCCRPPTWKADFFFVGSSTSLFSVTSSSSSSLSLSNRW